MLTQICFRDFKSLGQVDVNLGRLTVFVGPNGSGKSSAFQGLQLLSQCAAARPADNTNRWMRFVEVFRDRTSPRRLRRVGAKGSWELSAIRSDEQGTPLDTLILEAKCDGGDELENLGAFTFSVASPRGSLKVEIPVGDSEPALRRLNDPRVRWFSSMALLHLDAAHLGATSVSSAPQPRMGENGEFLASTLAWLKGEHEEVLEQIAVDLAQIVPGVRRIRTSRQPVSTRRTEYLRIDDQLVPRSVPETQMGDRFSVEFANGDLIPGDLLSEGTLLALGILTKLREPQGPRVLMLEDIDRGLHITAQEGLVAMLRRLLDQNPELQIVCTSHSPYLLDRFRPEEVRVFDLDTDRRTHVRPLNAHPEFDQWRYGTQTGELWATLGDAWVAEPER